MQYTFRAEQAEDHQAVFALIEQAFRAEVFSDHQEQFLVDRLRKTEAFIPELSRVAIHEDQIVGHVLLSKISIQNGEARFPSLALAPVSVLPDYQGQGIGGELIRRAHQKAKDLGFTSVILVGHENYYPRFGYQKAIDFGITFPFEVPEVNGMAIELVENALAEVQGEVVYSSAFF